MPSDPKDEQPVESSPQGPEEQPDENVTAPPYNYTTEGWDWSRGGDHKKKD
jgi:hypothetical protein